jgi:hypothetical protein
MHYEPLFTPPFTPEHATFTIFNYEAHSNYEGFHYEHVPHYEAHSLTSVRTCKAMVGSTKCGLKCCGGVKGADKCMVVNGIPPNTKLPPHIVAKIEKRAAEMKRGGKGGKSAMMAFGEDSDNSELDDEDMDGHAFVARCVQIDADGAEHFVEDDDDFEEVVAFEVVEPSGVGKDTIASCSILREDDAEDCPKPDFGDACNAETGGNCSILTVHAPRDTIDVRDAFMQAPVDGGVFVRPPPEDGGGEADNAEIGPTASDVGLLEEFEEGFEAQKRCVDTVVSIICDEENNDCGMKAADRAEYGYAATLSLELRTLPKKISNYMNIVLKLFGGGR